MGMKEAEADHLSSHDFYAMGNDFIYKRVVMAVFKVFVFKGQRLKINFEFKGFIKKKSDGLGSVNS